MIRLSRLVTVLSSLAVTQNSELALHYQGLYLWDWGSHNGYKSFVLFSTRCAIENARLYLEAMPWLLYNVRQEHHSIMENVCRYTLSTGMQYGRRMPVLHILQPIYSSFKPHISPWVFLFFGLSILCAFTISIRQSILLWTLTTENYANLLLNRRLNVLNPLSRHFIGYSEAIFLVEELHIYPLISISETSSEWGKLLQFSQM